jgi:hypothetical protein
MSLELCETRCLTGAETSRASTPAPGADLELISARRGRSRLTLPVARPSARNESARAVIPLTQVLLTCGGDNRIVCDAAGRNRYGCSSRPESDVLAYGSSTASTISRRAFDAADTLRNRLLSVVATEAPHAYGRELNRVRHELKSLFALENLTGLDIVFGASGTDLHLIASQFVSETKAGPALIVRVEASETGRGVPDALAGHHFGECAPFEEAVPSAATVAGARRAEILEIKCRATDGALRPLAQIDAEVETAVRQAATAGRRVLLTLVDVSKTGLLAPSPACVVALRRRFPSAVEVLVDACQLRLTSRTLRSYLENDFIVAITGSKFVTGPTFCGALLVPDRAARRLRGQPLPSGLRAYTARADWPVGWAAREGLDSVANFGLLLRWEAALVELRAFRRLADPEITRFLELFGAAVTHHLAQHPAFELLPNPVLDRGPIGHAGWDRLPTIFSFLLLRKSGPGERTFLTPGETKKIHDLLREDARALAAAPKNSLLALRCQLGQPVACGTRDGVLVSALRLCASTRLILDALSPEGRGTKRVIADALAALDKAALLAALPLA